MTEHERYRLPNMLDVLSRISGCAVFSKLDLRKGYHQIPMNPADISKTAIITPFGLFEYTRMPFGLKNAGSTFQRTMDRVLDGLDTAPCYLDDIILGSKDMASHEIFLVRSFSGSARRASSFTSRSACLPRILSSSWATGFRRPVQSPWRTTWRR